MIPAYFNDVIVFHVCNSANIGIMNEQITFPNVFYLDIGPDIGPDMVSMTNIL